jgi:hypothetical protein
MIELLRDTAQRARRHATEAALEAPGSYMAARAEAFARGCEEAVDLALAPVLPLPSRYVCSECGAEYSSPGHVHVMGCDRCDPS